ncbi:rRNA maturation RNase YbeY [Caulobacter endophyticus]|uniref:rRNA maturation RNase YbeY n=1 Tax=Caulobacter endophyticus TaxID=2172652 RepID=UPI00240F9AA0|nr:rRNA maturation RNase YbeY [Caulobacter endophyticus]MDG2531654.1 rRNA maturation RNase YbeY [Caulobacter endophyticus]
MEIEDEAWTKAEPEAEALVWRAAQAVLDAHEDVEGKGIVILLADDDSVQALNRDFRHKDYATNVLSFPAPQDPAANPEGQIGDIALAYGVCAREAAEQGKPLSHHLQHLVAHGVLHLLGYDHEGDEEAEAMEALEREILAGLDVPDPYADER